MIERNLRRMAIMAALMAPGPALAACADSAPDTPAILVAVREAMLAGDYEAFVARADAADRIAEPQKLNIVNVLTRAHPDGFDHCQVLVRRDLSETLFQELSVFSEGRKDWVFLYALGARIAGQETLLNFKFSNDVDEELAKFR